MSEAEGGMKPPPVHRYEATLLVAILILAAVVRIWDIGAKSFWFDELLAVERSRSIRQAIVDCQFGHEPPLRYIITHHLARFNPPEMFTRLPAFLFGVATIGALWLLARTLFGAAVAAVAAFLLAISPWHILHSQDVRMYAVMMFFWVLSLIFFFAVLDKPERPLPWLGLAISHAINFYLSYITLFMLVAEIIALIGVYCVRWRRHRLAPPEPTAEQEGAGERGEPAFSWKPYATGALIFAGFFGFFISFWLYSLLGVFDRYLGTSLVKTELMVEAVQEVRWLGWPAEFDPSFFAALFDLLLLPGRQIWRWAALVFCLAGLGLIWRRNRPLVWIAGLSFLIAVLTILFTTMRFFVAPRYVFHLLIFFILATAVTLVTVGEKLLSCVSPHMRRPLAASLIVIFLVIAVRLAYPTVWLFMRCERQDWRRACKFLAEHVRKPQPAEYTEDGQLAKEAVPGDLIITGPWGTHLAVEYYAPDELSSNTIRNCLTAESTEDEINRAQHGAWYVIWGHRPENLNLVISSFLEPVAYFPGLHGTVEIYRKRQQASDERERRNEE